MRRHSRTHAVWAVVLMSLFQAACLSKPAGPGGGAGDGGVGDGGTGLDGGNSCAAILPESLPFVAGVTVFGTNPKVADLNGDCLDDLLIPGHLDTGRPGVFLIYGRSSGFLDGYDVFLEADGWPGLMWEPLEIEVEDATGDGDPDLLVVGVDPGTGHAILLVYVGQGEASDPFARMPLVRLTSSSFMFSNSTTVSHEPAYVMAARDNLLAANGVVFGGSSWAVSLSLPNGTWSQPVLDLASLNPVQELDVAGIQGMMPAPATAPNPDGLLAVSKKTFTTYYAPGGSFIPQGLGIEISISGATSVVERGTAGFGEDFVLWSVSDTELHFSGMHRLTSTTAGLSVAWVAMPTDFVAGALRDLVVTELVGNASRPELVLLYEVDPSGARLRVYTDVSVTPGQVRLAGGAIADLPLDFHRLLSGSFTSTDSTAARQIWVIPSTVTSSVTPLCLSVLPTGVVDEFCFAVCGATEC